MLKCQACSKRNRQEGRFVLCLLFVAPGNRGEERCVLVLCPFESRVSVQRSGGYIHNKIRLLDGKSREILNFTGKRF